MSTTLNSNGSNGSYINHYYPLLPNTTHQTLQKKTYYKQYLWFLGFLLLPITAYYCLLIHITSYYYHYFHNFHYFLKHSQVMGSNRTVMGAFLVRKCPLSESLVTSNSSITPCYFLILSQQCLQYSLSLAA